MGLAAHADAALADHIQNRMTHRRAAVASRTSAKEKNYGQQ